MRRVVADSSKDSAEGIRPVAVGEGGRWADGGRWTADAGQIVGDRWRVRADGRALGCVLGRRRAADAPEACVGALVEELSQRGAHFVVATHLHDVARLGFALPPGRGRPALWRMGVMQQASGAEAAPPLEGARGEHQHSDTAADVMPVSVIGDCIGDCCSTRSDIDFNSIRCL